MATKPSTFFGTFAKIALITPLPFGVGSALLIAMRIGRTEDQISQLFTDLLPWCMVGGVFFGLLFGFVMAFFLKGATSVIPFQSKESFVSHINLAMADAGYQPDSQSENVFIYKPSFRAGLLSGKISIELGDNSATIIGPTIQLKKLHKASRRWSQSELTYKAASNTATKKPTKDPNEIGCGRCKFVQWEGYTVCQKCGAEFT